MIGSLFAVLFRSKPRNGTRDEGVELRGQELHVSLHLAMKKSARISADLNNRLYHWIWAQNSGEQTVER